MAFPPTASPSPGAAVLAISPKEPPMSPEGGDTGGDQDLSEDDMRALQDGVSPEAADVLRRVLPDECQFIVDALPEGDEGPDDAGSGDEAGAGDRSAPMPPMPPMARPMTKLGRM